ncbi:MAG TPA: hypothetical protein VGD59_08145 [Acidisarcina sp.]
MAGLTPPHMPPHLSPHMPPPSQENAALPPATEPIDGSALGRRQLRAIASLRRRLFLSALRRKGGAVEMGARFLLYPVLAIFAIAPAAVSGYAGFYAISRNGTAWLAGALWLIFFLWFFIGFSTSAAAPGFDLSTLNRFPIRFRDYLIVRLSFGLLDPPNLVAALCLLAMTMGIGFARPALAPWAALVLFFYGVSLLLFFRMLGSWLERWLARRRTREMAGAALLLFSLSFQLINPAVQYLTRHKASALVNARRLHTPLMLHAIREVVLGASALPPALAGNAIARMHQGRPLPASLLAGAVVLYAGGFLFVLSVRLRAQYSGENLNEPAALAPGRRRSVARTISGRAPGRGLLPPVISACLRKELLYILRSGPMLYNFVVPLFMVLIFGSRLYRASLPGVASLIFPYGCAYLQIFILTLTYNCFGFDGPGIQFYFFSSVRMRDVVIGKNLLSATVLAIEVVLIYLLSCLLSKRPPIGLTALTLAWAVFTYLVSVSVGNIQSLRSPRRIPEGVGVRGLKVSGVNSLIGLAVMFIPFLMGAGAVVLCRLSARPASSYWIAAGVFLMLGAGALAGYIFALGRIDQLAGDRRQQLAEELCRI